MQCHSRDISVNFSFAFTSNSHHSLELQHHNDPKYLSDVVKVYIRLSKEVDELLVQSSTAFQGKIGICRLFSLKQTLI